MRQKAAQSQHSRKKRSANLPRTPTTRGDSAIYKVTKIHQLPHTVARLRGGADGPAVLRFLLRRACDTATRCRDATDWRHARQKDRTKNMKTMEVRRAQSQAVEERKTNTTHSKKWNLTQR